MNNSFQMKIRQVAKFLPYLICLAFLVAMPVVALAATTVGNNVSVGGTLALTGAATFNGHSTLGNATTTDILYLNSRVASSIIPTANNSIDLGEFSRAYNDIFASGTAYLANATTTHISPWANNASNLGNYDYAWKNVFVSGTTYLTIADLTGAATLGSTLAVTGVTTLTGNTFVTGTLQSTGAVTAYGNVTLGDTVSDSIVITGKLGTIYISNGSTTSTLTNNSLILGEITGYNLGKFSVDSSGNLTTSGTIVITGTGATSLGGNLAVTGAATFNGHSTLGDATTTDRIFLNARVGSSIIPTADNSIDLGEFSRAYKNIYASSTAYLAGVTSTQISPWANNASDFGNYGFAYKDVFASGTAYSASSTVFNESSSSSVYIKSGTTNRGGQLILKAYDGNCYAVYIGKFNDGALGVTSTAVTCY